MIYHPNVNFHGTLKCSYYRNWNQNCNVPQLLDAIVDLFRKPDDNEHDRYIQNQNAWKIYQENKDEFDKNARRVTKMFAIPE